MIIVGEKINTSRRSIQEAVEKRDADFIIKTAKEQVDAGADYIDVNAGTFVDKETEHLCWLTETVQSAIDTPLCLDSPSAEALAKAMELHRGEPMINSVSLEEDRFQKILSVIKSKPCKVVALCMAQTSMPTTVEDRVSVAAELVGRLTAEGVPIENIFVDPLIQPVSVDTNMGLAALGAIKEIMKKFPGINTICGLSNVSFGLPERKLINRMFLALCMSHGLNGAILDPTDKQLMAALYAADMLLGNDEYCEKFIDAYQEGRLSGA
jgi:5-methyltetrahydrofolate--homocysteine methyltransferase